MVKYLSLIDIANPNFSRYFEIASTGAEVNYIIYIGKYSILRCMINCLCELYSQVYNNADFKMINDPHGESEQ